MTSPFHRLESRSRTMTRWMASAVLVLALHGAAAAFLFDRTEEEAVPDDTSGAIAVELAPVAAATPQDTPDVALGPQMEEAELTPQPAQKSTEEVDKEIPPVDQAPLAPQPEVVLPVPKPLEENKPIKEESQEATPETTAPVQVAAAPLTTAPPKIEAKESVTTVAPQSGDGAVPAPVLAAWQRSLLRHLNRFKRYPD